jgi:hypothetical protein
MSSATVRTASDLELSFFQENGWVHMPALIDSGAASLLRSHAEEALRARARTGDYGPVVERNFRPFPGEGRDTDFSRQVVQSRGMGSLVSALLDVSEVRLLADGYLLKMPESEGSHDGTLYHQDFPGNPVDRSSFLTVWIALHDMTAEQGTMRFYSRSHRLGVFGQAFADGMDLRTRCRALKEEDLSTPLLLHAGDATIHHSLTVHGAPPNRTSKPRWAYNILYMDGQCRYTMSPGMFPQGVSLAPFALFDHPMFPMLPVGAN